MSNKKDKVKKNVVEGIGADINAPSSVTPVFKFEPTEFEKAIKDFCKDADNVKLERVENLGGSEHEQYDIDISLTIPEQASASQHLDRRREGAAQVHQIKQDLYNRLHELGYNIATMSVRGVRVEGDEAKTTISLTLSNVPKVHRDHTQRIGNLLESVINEVLADDKQKDNKDVMSPNE